MTELILVIFLLILASVTAASETSITAVSRVKLRRMAASGSRKAKRILKILEAPERFFGTIIVANNIVNVLIASILTAVMINLMHNEERGISLATVIATIAIIVSEVSSKTLAAKRSEKISFGLSALTDFLIWIFSPIVNLLARFVNLLMKALGAAAEGRPALVTEEEIRAFIKMGEEEGVIGKEKIRMLSRIFDFGDTMVRAVMTPKAAIVALDVGSKYEDIMRMVLESGYSRLPVYSGDADNIIGVVNVKDLLNFWENRDLIILKDMLHQPTYVTGSRKVNELLKEFQLGHTHMAIVVDARGKIEGVVTLEDILEEIVGEIADEYDVQKPEIEKIDGGRYVINGRCRLKKLNKEININLPEKEFITIGNYIKGTLKRLPEKGERIPLDGWTCVVKKVEDSRIVEMELLCSSPA